MLATFTPSPVTPLSLARIKPSAATGKRNVKSATIGAVWSTQLKLKPKVVKSPSVQAS